MKKIILIIISLVCFIPISQAETIAKVYINPYYFVIDNNIERHTDKANMFQEDKKILYCLEPGVKMPTTNYQANDDSILKLKEVDKKYIELVGYFGYDYPKHQTDKYYMAAQELIWEKITNYQSYFSTSLNGPDNVNLEQEKEEILSLVNRYDIMPSFSSDYSMKVGTTLTLEDSNQILNQCSIKNSSTFLKRDGNIMTLHSIVPSHNKITLEKNLYDNKKTIIYSASGSQTLGYLRPSYQPQKDINIQFIGLQLSVNKIDSQNLKYKGEAVLEGAKYGLYEYGQLINTYTTDKNGKFSIPNLYAHNYTIRELTPSKGYNLSTLDYIVNMDDDKTINVAEKIISSNVTIQNNCDNQPSPNSKFSIYDLNDQLIYEDSTDNNGQVKTDLVYGHYYIVQNTNENCTIDKTKHYINIDNNKKQNITISNQKNIENHVSENTYNIPNTAKISIFSFLGFIVLLGSYFVYKKF